MTARKKPGEVTEVAKGEVAIIDNNALRIVPQESQYVGMLNMAIDKNIDMEKLERIVALQSAWEEKEAKKLFLQSHSAFQTEVPIIYKQGHADFGEGKASYDYAKLEDIAEGIKPYLARNGLSYSWECGIDQGIITVTCTLSHISGHSKSSTMISSPDSSGGKNGIHQIASARSYLKRYTLLDVGGITVSGEDDDGHAAIETTNPSLCTTEHFNANLDKWQEQILVHGKTPQYLIDFLGSKDVILTDEQQQILHQTGVK